VAATEPHEAEQPELQQRGGGASPRPGPAAAPAEDAGALEGGPSPLTRLDRAVSWALFAAGFGVLLLVEAAVGFTRDESVYFAAAESYARWFQLLWERPGVALTDAAIVRAWDVNHEHPVLLKSLFGLSHLLFHDTLGWARDATAYRLPAFAFAALIPLLVYRMGVGLSGRAAALFAAVSFLLVPRQLFNSVLSCFDVPVATMWLWVVYLFWRAQQSTRAGLLCGVAFGLALATKHNALFLPFVLVPFALHAAWRGSVGHPEARRTLGHLVALGGAVAGLSGLLALILGPHAFQRRFVVLSPHTLLCLVLALGATLLLVRLRGQAAAAFRAVLPVVAMAVVGPVLFFLHWPYLWHHPVDRTAWYLAFHARHNHYAWFYLGTLLRAPPFPLAYVLVKTALTVPTSLLVPMATGWLAVAGRALLQLCARTRAWVRPVSFGEALVLVNAAVPIAIISHPQVPHFGGVKHWLPAMPFLALLAGAAVVRAGHALAAHLSPRLPAPARSLRAIVVAALSLLLLAPALWATMRVWPYGTAAYSELAGGLPGAASLGMQRQFWSSHVTGVLPWLNAHAPQGARVWLHEVNGYSFRDYQANGMLRRDLRPAVGPGDSDFAVYQYHQEFRANEYDIWQAYGTTQPITGLYVDETPQVVVYQRP
jgi:Dolichyl-phosphate-mannose-protein mannosyltransferase